MFRKILLIFLFCGLIALSVVLEYRANAAGAVCEQPRDLCVPVKLLMCVTPDCEVMPPLLRRSCAQAWRRHLIANPLRSPQRPCFVDVPVDPLQTVARVSTLDITRAIGR